MIVVSFKCRGKLNNPVGQLLGMDSAAFVASNNLLLLLLLLSLLLFSSLCLLQNLDCRSELFCLIIVCSWVVAS
jgi:hypothetical protein